jgi:hypothetical protein
VLILALSACFTAVCLLAWWALMADPAAAAAGGSLGAALADDALQPALAPPEAAAVTQADRMPLLPLLQML